MGVHFQLRRAVFTEILLRLVQKLCNDSCFPEISGHFIDRINVASRQIGVNQLNDSIEFVVPLDVFAIKKSDLLVAPNTTPPGVANAAITANFYLKLSVDAFGDLQLRADKVQKDIVAPGFEILASLGDSLFLIETFDFRMPLASVLRQTLAVQGINGGKCVSQGANIDVYLNQPADAVDRTRLNQVGALFLDRNIVTAQIRSELAAVGRIHSESWRTQTDQAFWDVELFREGDAPDGVSGTVHAYVKFEIGFSLVRSGLTPKLRLTLTYTGLRLELHDSGLGGLIEGIIEPSVRAVAEDKLLQKLESVAAGNLERVNERNYYRDTDLPAFNFGTNVFSFTGLNGFHDGFALAGRFSLMPTPETLQADLTVEQFGSLVRITTCSSGQQSNRPILPFEVSTFAKAELEHGIRICENGVSVLPPNDASSLLEAAISRKGTTVQINLSAPGTLQVTGPIRAIVRTPRGVRFVDFGEAPRAQISNGRVENAQDVFLDNCLYIPWREKSWLDIVNLLPEEVPGFDDGPGLPPIVGGLQWLGTEPVALNAVVEVTFKTLQISGLQHYERVQAVSGGQLVTVAADSHGMAIVPVTFMTAAGGRDNGQSTLRFTSPASRVQTRVLRSQSYRTIKTLRGNVESAELDGEMLLLQVTNSAQGVARLLVSADGNLQSAPEILVQHKFVGKQVAAAQESALLTIIGQQIGKQLSMQAMPSREKPLVFLSSELRNGTRAIVVRKGEDAEHVVGSVRGWVMPFRQVGPWLVAEHDGVVLVMLEMPLAPDRKQPPIA